MEIDSQALTTCDVSQDGGAISLSFADTIGNPATIRLSLDQAGALLMTLPGLIDRALQTRFGDQSLHYAYPLASWVIEQSSNASQCIITLRTAASAFPFHSSSRLNSARRWRLSSRRR